MRPIPELVVIGARIRTMDPAQPFAEALAVAGGRLVAVGRAGDVEALVGPGTRIVRLGGKTIWPGLIDSHLHGLAGARRDLFDIHTEPNEKLGPMLEAVAQRAAQLPVGKWITGGEWFSFNRPEMGNRPADLLDRIAPDHPVALNDVSHHNLWLNSAALAAAGIDRTTPEVPGGQIERDPEGHPTGILIETAVGLVQPFVAPTDEELAAAALHFARVMHGYGITACKEAMAFEQELRAYAAADKAGKLNLHLGAHLTRSSPVSDELTPMEDMAAWRAAHQAPHVHTAFAKLFIDGVPISRTAAFTEPYVGVAAADHDPDAGLLLSPERLAEEVTALDADGYTVKMHAVGDRAVQVGLDAIAAAREANGQSGLRHEIAHTNFVREADLRRFALLGAVAEVSPKLWFPGPVTAGQRGVLGGARTESCHPIRSLIEASAEVIYGSDWPAAAPDANPWIGLTGMLTRRDATGRYPGALGVDQSIGLEEALPLFTLNGARALGLAGRVGILAPGASADFIVLDKDPADLSPSEFAATRPSATIFEGRIVHGGL